MRLREPGRNNPNNFFSISFNPCVNNEEHYSRSDCSQGVPSLFVLNKRVTFCQSVGIIEGESRSLETNVMLPQVQLILRLIPFKAHSYFLRGSRFQDIQKSRICQYMCMYTN